MPYSFTLRTPRCIERLSQESMSNYCCSAWTNWSRSASLTSDTAQ